MRFALELSEDVRAIHILTQDSTITELTPMWEELVGAPARAAGLPVPQLVLRKSTYRQFFAPAWRSACRRGEHAVLSAGLKRFLHRVGTQDESGEEATPSARQRLPRRQFVAKDSG
jgi:hypothetical protein